MTFEEGIDNVLFGAVTDFGPRRRLNMIVSREVS
jgi:hypothetical protein